MQSPSLLIMILELFNYMHIKYIDTLKCTINLLSMIKPLILSLTHSQKAIAYLNSSWEHI